jgi:P pilus assembly chaperone PapD
MAFMTRFTLLVAAVAAFVAVTSTGASAQMVLDKVVIDFIPGKAPRDDVVVQNPGKEPLFVVVEPFRVMDPGKPTEQRVEYRDPGELGLLVTPNRFVVQPGQRKVVRFAIIEPAIEEDKIYRVTLKPVVGNVQSSTTAVKVVFGYDLLIIVRPPNAQANISSRREGGKLIVENTGNTNALLSQGKQCDAGGENCVELPPKRMYPGATWEVPLERDTPIEYYVTSGGKVTRETF